MDLHNEQNLLIGSSNSATRDALLEFAICAASADHYVLYLTRTPFDYIPGGCTTSALLLSRNRSSISKNIVFMYPQTYTELVDRLCTLHSWLKSPSIIIVDSLHAFGSSPASSSLFTHPSDKEAQQCALVMATLLDLASGLRTKSSTKCLTILTLNPEHVKADTLHKCVQIYYYTNNYLRTEGERLLNELKEFI